MVTAEVHLETNDEKTCAEREIFTELIESQRRNPIQP
jgi:hypothetical protein